ncbi:hypothetical protein [Aquibacillus salsiterrae]|uniref:Uncharacterized protein n=1 Tax=Aquibacillus salsiterrae TaxID=2950439 RepID=A0A9X3WFT3_9BACI|nr:hypothetical protein [Aquibacillus salsiterrae]MDC3417540.1 hypothetical protein [Aquibacillus salsiterrae]
MSEVVLFSGSNQSDLIAEDLIVLHMRKKFPFCLSTGFDPIHENTVAHPLW